MRFAVRRASTWRCLRRTPTRSGGPVNRRVEDGTDRNPIRAGRRSDGPCWQRRGDGRRGQPPPRAQVPRCRRDRRARGSSPRCRQSSVRHASTSDPHSTNAVGSGAAPRPVGPVRRPASRRTRHKTGTPPRPHSPRRRASVRQAREPGRRRKQAVSGRSPRVSRRSLQRSDECRPAGRSPSGLSRRPASARLATRKESPQGSRTLYARRRRAVKPGRSAVGRHRTARRRSACHPETRQGFHQVWDRL